VKLIAEFEIQGLPKTTNSMVRLHWAVKSKLANKWKQLVLAECLRLKICDLKLDQARLTLTRHSSVTPDADGLVSSFKCIIDALVLAGVLTNDKVTNIGMPNYKWERAKKNAGRITVRIEAPDKELESAA
jgi:hypothetical protein